MNVDYIFNKIRIEMMIEKKSRSTKNKFGRSYKSKMIPKPKDYSRRRGA